jgi:putative transposase
MFAIWVHYDAERHSGKSGMTANNRHHHRRSIRLPAYDYSGEGPYYVTICTQDRLCLFGRVANGEMALNERGRFVQQCWDELTGHYAGIELDAFVIMPNHVHGIVVITGGAYRRGGVTPPLLQRVGDERGVGTTPLQGTRKHTLGQIMAYYKYQTTKIINQINNSPGRRIWQRNYWEHVIRNDNSYDTIRQYILENPLYCSQDEENPDRKQFETIQINPRNTLNS